LRNLWCCSRTAIECHLIPIILKVAYQGQAYSRESCCMIMTEFLTCAFTFI
jgi:hypothetical protein